MSEVSVAASASPSAPSNQDAAREHGRLFFEGNWLFEDEGDVNELEVIEVDPESGIFKTKLKATTAALDIPKPRKDGTEIFFIIRQYNTWHRLKITASAFEKLFIQLKPFPYFVDFLRAFGTREDDDLRIVSGYRWWHSILTSYDEFAYNVRFFEQNGRDYGMPWSLRHTGVYEKLHLKTLKPTWLLIQPSVQILQHLEEYFALSVKNPSHHAIRSLHLHVLIMFATSRTWLDFIDYIRSRIDELGKKAVFSRVGKSASADYSVEFLDCQRLDRLQTNIMRAQEVLHSNIGIIHGCQARCRHLSSLFDIAPDLTPLGALETQEHELSGYETTLKGILKHSEKISRLLGKILEFRHDETMRIQTALLTELSRQQTSTNEQVAQMQKKAAKDSRLLKSLTIMASLYLPTSVVLAFFGSNLVQTHETGALGQRMSIFLVQEAWLAVAVPIPLTLATLGLILWMMRRTRNIPE